MIKIRYNMIPQSHSIITRYYLTIKILHQISIKSIYYVSAYYYNYFFLLQVNPRPVDKLIIVINNENNVNKLFVKNKTCNLK